MEESKDKQLERLVKEEDELDEKRSLNEISDADYLKWRKEILERAKEVIRPTKINLTSKCTNIQKETKDFIRWCMHECGHDCGTDKYERVRAKDNYCK